MVSILVDNTLLYQLVFTQPTVLFADWHSLPQIKDAVYDGIPDDLARFNDFIWHERPLPQAACGNFEFY